MAKIRVTQVKSKIGRPERQKRTMLALGLKKKNPKIKLSLKKMNPKLKLLLLNN